MRALFFILCHFLLIPLSPALAQAVEVQSDALQRFCQSFEASSHSVPADVEDDGAMGVGTIRFPVTIDLSAAFGLSLPAGVELEPDVAQIEITPDGRVIYNDKDLSPMAQDICNDISSTSRKSTAIFTRGQRSIDALEQVK